MSDLHLHVKTEYFEAIKRGEKTEEYRIYNDYWRDRLGFICGSEACAAMRGSKVKPHDYAGIVIHNAYKPGPENTLRFPWRGWEIKQITHPHFGLDEVTVFAIRLEPEASR